MKGQKSFVRISLYARKGGGWVTGFARRTRLRKPATAGAPGVDSSISPSGGPR